jgi:hypothetical protein
MYLSIFTISGTVKKKDVTLLIGFLKKGIGIIWIHVFRRRWQTFATWTIIARQFFLG